MPYPAISREFKKKFPNYLSNTLRNLTEPRASASKWNESHLEALRVLLIPAQKGDCSLPILEPYLQKARSELELHREFKEKLQVFGSDAVQTLSHSELFHTGGRLGSMYQSLAIVLETSQSQQNTESRPSREPSTPNREGFVSGDGLGLSSPLGSDNTSESEYAPSESSGLSRRTNDARRKPEVATSTLALSFLSAVLALTRNISEPTQLEVLTVPTTLKVQFGRLDYMCIDDGSLVYRKTGEASAGKWVSTATPVPCGVESKAGFASWEGGEAGVSTRVLAQRVGEMLGMIHRNIINVEDPNDINKMTKYDRTVFLIVAHQDRVRFTSATFEPDYIEYLTTPTKNTSTFLHVEESRDYVLSNPEDRLEAAVSTIALSQYLEQSLPKAQGTGDG
ncbi:hypothetical protein GP486_002897 [Trichoglossum hirsutum]|uniref:Uncharacterized protein n=1 Tax=Trichoglossum hirsutum TaxID=265104 RepID=A0A9P8LEC5_9PEZI|nr:hypothetical protein GP486_002897 [Trichoglossum hirsutum]